MSLLTRIINWIRGRYDSVSILRDQEYEPDAYGHSEFPHPVVTLDFDAAGNLVQVIVVGRDMSINHKEY